MNDIKQLFYESWLNKDGNVYKNSEIDYWIDDLNEKTNVEIKKISLEECGNWFYDKLEGQIRNKNRSFFSVKGFQKKKNEDLYPVLSEEIKEETEK